MKKHTQTKTKANRKAPQALKLGNKEDIRLIGVYENKGVGDELTACFDTGLLRPDGRRHMLVRRLGVTSHEEAQRIADGLLTQLRAEWDRHAASLLAKPDATSALAPMQPIPSLEAVMLQALTRMDVHPNLHSFSAYKSAARRFLLASGDSAKKSVQDLSLEDCIRARNGMLTDQHTNTSGSRQTMRNLRFVLARVPGFPPDLICRFHVCARHGERQTNLPVPFLPEERRSLILNLELTDWTTRGLCLLGANYSMLAGDVATVTWQQLRAASDDTSPFRRIKTNSAFSSPMWPATKNWMNERPHDPAAVYVFPELVFTAKELAQNPGINSQTLDRHQTRNRMACAAHRAFKKFNEYLQQCGIKRKGVSFRSFRWTNTATW